MYSWAWSLQFTHGEVHKALELREASLRAKRAKVALLQGQSAASTARHQGVPLLLGNGSGGQGGAARQGTHDTRPGANGWACTRPGCGVVLETRRALREHIHAAHPKRKAADFIHAERPPGSFAHGLRQHTVMEGQAETPSFHPDPDPGSTPET